VKQANRWDIVILLRMPHCGMSPDGQQTHGNLMSYKGGGLSRNFVCLTQPAHFSEFLPILHA